MQNKTSVYFFDELVGELSQDKYGTICFQYTHDYVKKKGNPISHSLPLTTEIYYGNEAHAFFTGLLPEENILTATANAIGTSSLNYFKLLTELGKEPVGAIQIGQPTAIKPFQYEEITLEELNQFVDQNDSLLSTLYHEKELRLSLAGAQSKTGLFYENNLLPIAEKVLSENLFPDHFRNAFYEHLKKMHTELKF